MPTGFVGNWIKSCITGSSSKLADAVKILANGKCVSMIFARSSELNLQVTSQCDFTGLCEWYHFTMCSPYSVCASSSEIHSLIPCCLCKRASFGDLKNLRIISFVCKGHFSNSVILRIEYRAKAFHRPNHRQFLLRAMSKSRYIISGHSAKWLRIFGSDSQVN